MRRRWRSRLAPTYPHPTPTLSPPYPHPTPTLPSPTKVLPRDVYIGDNFLSHDALHVNFTRCETPSRARPLEAALLRARPS